MSKNNRNINRAYPLNTKFFNKIDSEEKAYWLGFLYADGCVSLKGQQISIILQHRDINHLEKFKKSIGTTKPVKVIMNQVRHFAKDRFSICSSARLFISSKDMGEDLIKLGCFEAKSLTLKFPTEEQIPNNLLNHFIRGYFDGDGCVSFTKRETRPIDTYKVSFVGSLSFLTSLKIFLSETLRVSGSKIRSQGKIFALEYGGNKQSLKIMSFMFNGATIFLDRKYDKYTVMTKCLNKFNFLRDDGSVISFSNLTTFCELNPRYKTYSLRRVHNGVQKKCLDLVKLSL